MKKTLLALLVLFSTRIKVFVVFIRDSNPEYGAGFCACHAQKKLYVSKAAAEKAAEEINRVNHGNPGGTFCAYAMELEL
jgi:hypothetical protein